MPSVIINSMRMLNTNHRIGKYSLMEWLIIGVFVYFFVVLERMMLGRIMVLLISVVIHEVAHGMAALWCGDQTAKRQGRLTLNPIHHIDPLGSIFLPLMLVVSGSPFLFGWAKPVPVNTQQLNHPINDMLKVAIAGPLSNITLAVLCSVIIKVLIVVSPTTIRQFPWVIELLSYGVIINIVLAVFNMIPIPPMDGSRVLYRYLPDTGRSWLDKMEPYGLLIIILLSFFGFFSVILRVFSMPLIHLLL